MKFLLLGITQGFTEFLPVSSSGHLYILKHIFNIPTDLLPFFTFLHIATLSAIVMFLWKKILALFTDVRLLMHIGLITIITAALGITIDIFLRTLFENKFFVPLCLLINGGILLTMREATQARELKDLTIKDSIIIGVLQGIAIFPGISRSGITIVGIIKRGFKPQEAFALSFLMAIPAIIGAFLLKSKHLFDSGLTGQQLCAGFFAALICGIISLQIVKKSLISKKFSKFGYYCIIIAIISLLV